MRDVFDKCDSSWIAAEIEHLYPVLAIYIRIISLVFDWPKTDGV